MVEQVQQALSEGALQETKQAFETGMAAAGTALTAMLNRQTEIRTEDVRQGDLAELAGPDVAGTLAFRIGNPEDGALCGAALFPRRDVQRVLGVLMGGDGGDAEGMPFDEMNLSAACEVVSQMLEAAAAELTGRTGQNVRLNAFQGVEVEKFIDLADLLEPGTSLVQVTCVQRVRDVLEGRFTCLLPTALAGRLAQAPGPDPAPQPAPAPAPEGGGQAQPEAPPAPPVPEAPADQPELNVRRARFPDFGPRPDAVEALSTLNASLLMGVPLEVSIVIGRAKRKIRDILEFGPGTVIDLDKQTGAPAEIIVNGQLLAYGDIIVIGDNYGVRITEIVGTKELLDSLGDG